MARTLAYQIELALEGVALEAVSRGDENLLDLRGCRQGARPQIGLVRPSGNHPPADQSLALFLADLLDNALAFLPLRVDRGEKDDPRGESAGLGKLDSQIILCDPGQKAVRQRREDAGAIAGIRFGSTGASVVHAAQEMFGVTDDLVAGLALHMGDESNTTTVPLPVGGVQPVCRRKCAPRLYVATQSHAIPWRSRRSAICRASWRPGAGDCGRAAEFFRRPRTRKRTTAVRVSMGQCRRRL